MRQAGRGLSNSRHFKTRWQPQVAILSQSETPLFGTRGQPKSNALDFAVAQLESDKRQIAHRFPLPQTVKILSELNAVANTRQLVRRDSFAPIELLIRSKEPAVLQGFLNRFEGEERFDFL